MAVQNIELYEYMKDKECHLYEEDGEVIAYMLIYRFQLDAFVSLVGASYFDEGGMDAKIFEHYIAIDVNDILEGEGEFLYEYRSCFDEDEFERYKEKLKKEYDENQ